MLVKDELLEIAYAVAVDHDGPYTPKKVSAEGISALKDESKSGAREIQATLNSRSARHSLPAEEGVRLDTRQKSGSLRRRDLNDSPPAPKSACFRPQPRKSALFSRAKARRFAWRHHLYERDLGIQAAR